MTHNNNQIPEIRLYRGFACRDAYTLTHTNNCATASFHLPVSYNDEHGTVLNGGSHYISTYVKIQHNKKVRISILVGGTCLHSITYYTSHALDTLEKAVDKAIEVLNSMFKNLLFELGKV